MGDPNIRLGVNGELEVYEVVIILVHRSVQRVFDGNNRRVHFPVGQRDENIFEPLARHHLCVRPEQLLNR
jgi:hypothetical protein